MPKIRASSVGAHKALVRAQLLDAFEELLLETPYEEVSIAAVAARAGVARNTVYNYASDKAELLGAAARRHVGLLLVPLQRAAEEHPEPVARMRAMLEAVFAELAESRTSPVIFQMLMRHGRDEDTEHAALGADALLPFIVGALEEGTHAGDFRRVGDLFFVLDLVASVLVTTVERLLEDPREASARIADGIDFIMGALAAR